MQSQSTLTEERLVTLLREHGTLTAIEAGRLLGVDRGTVRPVLDRLRRRGVVEFRATAARNRSWGDGSSAGIWTLRG